MKKDEGPLRQDECVRCIPAPEKVKAPVNRSPPCRTSDGKGVTDTVIIVFPTLEDTVRVASVSSGPGVLNPRPPPGSPLDGLLWGFDTYEHPADVLADPAGFIGFVQVCREYLINGASGLTPEARVALRHLVDNFPDDGAVVQRAQDFVETVKAVQGLVERSPVRGSPT